MSQTNTLSLRRIEEINNSEYTFYIPSYQRGYRWDAKQVTELLDDIQEAMLTRKGEYCLQPVVVKLREDGRFEVIDGQQRLTTVHLILLRLSTDESMLFNLDYETRENCTSFFKGLKSKNYNSDNPDFAHISTAYQEIDKWVESRGLVSPHAVAKLLQVIWYELPRKQNEEDNRDDSVKIFTRLNVGKIPLTSAELIKAIFLSSDNLNVSSNKYGDYHTFDSQSRQVELASDWTQMEYALQEESFWNFINRDENKATTRIDFLFELIARMNGAPLDDENDVFRFYYRCFVQAKKGPKQEKMLLYREWSEVKNCFMVLREWFVDGELYHLIGYLIWAGVDILDLYKDYCNESKSRFVELLNGRIGDTLGKMELSKLVYGQHEKVTKVMVLFNAISAMNSLDRSLRFPFELLKLKDNHWSLEHIHAQNAQEVNQKDYGTWMTDHRSVLEKLEREGSRDLLKSIEEFLKLMRENPRGVDIKSEFEQLGDEITVFLSAQDTQKKHSDDKFKQIIHIDHISNMALLDGKSNSALNNSTFAVKRERILQKERDGAFVPQATKNVFLKYYTDYPEHLIRWTIEDREKYLDKIDKLISPFIKN